MPVYRIGLEKRFPPVRHAEKGLLAYGGDLSIERLLLAYQQGIFPWYSEGDPILWWAPEERMIILPPEIHVSRRLARILRQNHWEVKADTCFDCVIQCCASAPRNDEGGTWILPEMQQAYGELHREGYAHSIELFNCGVLVGGLYGVSLGGVFFGESMFSLESNASKVCLAVLARQCERWNMDIIDCQLWTEHLASMGARLVTRATFMGALRVALKRPTRRGAWILDRDILAACATRRQDTPR